MQFTFTKLFLLHSFGQNLIKQVIVRPRVDPNIFIVLMALTPDTLSRILFKPFSHDALHERPNNETFIIALPHMLHTTVSC